jgi:hypothetical protein
MKKLLVGFTMYFLTISLSQATDQWSSNKHVDEMAGYNVVWTAPGKDSSGSMPIGNGTVGVNVWVEENGDLLMYISSTETWSENCRLLKLGRVRISLSPNPFAKGQLFRQTLKLHQGEIEISAGPDDRHIKIDIWVDANRPVVHIDAEGSKVFDITVSLESWRKERRLLEGDELHSAYGLNGDNPDPVYVEPDVIVPDRESSIFWYHRNERSCYEVTLKHQGLTELLPVYPDPLVNRTFGACIKGDGLVSKDDVTLASDAPAYRFTMALYPLTAQTETFGEWMQLLNDNIEAVDKVDLLKARAEHRQWWIDYWSRSWIRAEGTKDAVAVSRGYVLQSWINACGGRGPYPIKFNGSIFTVDAVDNDKRYDADYRRWGGPYWFQNTRLPYWSMPASGCFDLMMPLFAMYIDALPMAEERTRIYYGHEGAYFPETMYFWGTYTNSNYGWTRTDEPPGTTVNRYIRYEWQGGIELAVMMLSWFEHTQDDKYFRTALLPFIEQLLTFYDLHYSRDENGRIRFEPAQALETYWDSVNPMPEIAGLKSLLAKLLGLPAALVDDDMPSRWQRLLGELPPLPTREIDGVTVLSPAGIIGPKNNRENPELYAIFPYELYCAGKEDIGLAKRTFEKRIHKTTGGWSQDAIQAALLGLADEAGRMVTENFTTKHGGSRFLAFWGPNYDWIPDQDHGSVAMIALQKMLLRTEGRMMYLLPAWPKEWDVHFKLHAPYKTTVEGKVRDGKLEMLQVTPVNRLDDIVVAGEWK